ncbi:TcpQ domain-containing protein [Paraburkholderia youngii]|uniref:TcpQ domain-containing protein n=1 Tax=Paraburkholderia youngii TaxID=2782701 RepID=UPI003D22E03D
MKGYAMRRHQSSWTGLRAAPNLVLVTLAAAIAASSGAAYAARPPVTDLGMAEQAAPPGEGWSLISSTGTPATQPAPAVQPAPVATTTPAIAPASTAATGWQLLSAGDRTDELAPSASPTNQINVPVPPATPVAPAADPYVLVGGKSLQAQILGWGKRSGWAIDWRTPDDWIVPNDKAFSIDFEVAVRDVFDQASANGADVRVDIWEGNRSIVVDKTGAEQ